MLAEISHILQRAQLLGIVLEVEGDNLTYSPRSKTPLDLVEEMRQHKAALIQELKKAAPGESLADTLEASIALGKRLASGEIAALRCGISGKRCTLCYGIPCKGSSPW